MFVTVEDLAERMGMDFTEAQVKQAEQVLRLATSEIAAVCDEDDDWAQTLNPVPGVLKVVCMEVGVRAMVNAENVRSRQEQLGQYMLSETYISGGAIELTKTEQLRVRNAVFGQLSASPRLPSIIEEVIEYNDIIQRFPDGNGYAPLGSVDDTGVG